MDKEREKRIRLEQKRSQMKRLKENFKEMTKNDKHAENLMLEWIFELKQQIKDLENELKD